jgi:hypothetical protein
MMKNGWALWCVAMVSVSGTAQAQTVSGFGSAVYTTLRSCTRAAATEACDGTGPGQRIIQSNIGGGVNQAADVTFNATGVGAGSSAYGAVTFGQLGLPVVKAAAVANNDMRVNSNVYFYQTYTYAGTAPVEFGLAGTMHIVDSTTDGQDGTRPNGAILYAGLTIWDARFVTPFTDVDSMVFNEQGVFGQACGTAGVLGTGGTGGALGGGEQSSSFATAGCGGSPIMMNPGDTYLLAGLMQFPVNRGGSIDATHTFRVDIDPALPEASRIALAQNLQPVAPAVPEPTTWAMMVLGFGMVGAAARRRYRGVAIA